MATTDIPADLNNAAGMGRLISLMEEYLNVVHRIDQRQAAADVSAQPFPQVPQTSSSVWDALLRSRIAETIQPQVERWRSGLDALLVFLGLFCGIVASFLVSSLTGLQPDEVARTNELLANLTEIVIQLSAGANISTLKVSAPAPFQPDPLDIRLNSYWSISLTLSLSIAALAVACRGFLNMATLSRHTKAVDKLMDINARWKRAEKLLGPTLEIIPQFLVIPVILFVVGLLDSIFTSIHDLEPSLARVPIDIASGLSCFCIAGVVALLACALVDASFRPGSSPFQSTLAHLICKAFGIVDKYGMDMISTYHETVQATHADETLDKASTALGGIIRAKSYWSWGNDLQNTLVHLLSPEASRRCNRTAAHVIVELGDFFKFATRSDAQSLLSGLAEAAYRSAINRPIGTLWTATYIKACAVIVGAFHEDHPPVVCIIGSDYADRPMPKRIESMDLLLLDILFDHLDHVSPEGRPMPPSVELFKPDFIAARNVLAFLADLDFSNFSNSKASVIISLLMAAKTPAMVLSPAREIVEGRLLMSNWVGFLVVKAVLNLPEQAADWENVCLLEDLCSTCITITKADLSATRGDIQYYSPTYLADYRRQIPAIVNAALARLPRTGTASAALRKLMTDLREFFPNLSRQRPELFQPPIGHGGEGGQKKQDAGGGDPRDSNGAQEDSSH
ncbi:hypothetical protein B0H17DRAFT_1198753 [Mycena rosella]|uniref:DUF6535 domain-containing protein n=1 Tax=Mycena rosella TaxID=1033263 RepID=A0AAD7DN09_MYCRO|nr:hypothetical protein B0H17DRAFT_1198753 [Mycena rosella]